MSRTKRAKDKKPRKKETRVRNTFGYFLRWQIKKGKIPDSSFLSLEKGYMLKISGLFDSFVEERYIEATISNFNLVN